MPLFWIITFMIFLLAGLFHRSLRQILNETFIHPRDIIANAIHWLRSKSDAISSSIRQYFREEGLQTLNKKVSVFIGSLIYTGFFVVFCFADFFVTLKTLEAFGLVSTSVKLPTSIGVLVGISLTVSEAFSSMLLFDIFGVTYFWTWDKLPNLTFRKLLMALAFSILGLVVLIMVALGAYRTYAVNSPLDTLSSESGQLQQNIWIYMIFIGLTVLTTLAAFFASAIGPPTLLQFLFIGGVASLLIPLFLLRCIVNILSSVLFWIWGLLSAIFQLTSRVAIMVFRPIFGKVKETELSEDASEPVDEERNSSLPSKPGQASSPSELQRGDATVELHHQPASVNESTENNQGEDLLDTDETLVRRWDAFSDD